MENHDITVGEMLDSNDDEAIGLTGRPADLQFVRLCAAFNRQKLKIQQALELLNAATSIDTSAECRCRWYHRRIHEILSASL